MGKTSYTEERRILVVDDDPDFAREQVALLEGHGYTLQLAQGKAHAEKILEDFDPHIALVDYRLVNHSGTGLLEFLRSHNPDLHCIIQDVLPDTDAAVQSMRQGASDYLDKSAEQKKLLEILARGFAKSESYKKITPTEPATRGNKSPITEFSDAVSNIKQYESLFNQAARLGNLGYWVWDEIEGRCVYASEEYARIQGLTVDEVLNNYNTVMSDLELVHPDDREQFLKVSETGSHEVYESEYRIIRPDGELRYVYELGQDISDDKGATSTSVGILQDITDRKEAEIALRNNESLLELAAQIAGLGHYVLDLSEDRYLHVSQEYARILGRTVDEILSHYNTSAKNILLVHPDDREWVLSSYSKAKKSPERIKLEYRIVRPDGEVRFLVGTTEPAADHKGKFTNMVGVVQDVTEQIKAQRELAKRELLLKQAAMLSKLGHAVWNETKKQYIHVSDEYAHIFGYTTDEFLARFRDLENEMELVHPEDRAMVEAVNDSPEGARIDCEYRVFHKDGSLRHVREIMMDSVAEQGAMRTSIATLQDITDLKQTQQALEEREAQFNQVARFAHLGYWQADEKKDEYISVSDEFARIHGYTVDEFMERFRSIKKDFETVHPDDRARIQERYDKDDETVQDFRIVHRDGSVRHVRELYESVLDESGDVLSTLGYLQDITEMKQAEIELRAAKEAAEKANRAKSEFLSQMSHELRTPLNAVLGFGRLLQTTPAEQLEDTGPEFIDHIVNAGQHLLTLIDEVLDLAGIESGRVSLSIEAVDLGMVLQNCAHLIRPIADKRRIELDIQVKPGSAPDLRADKSHLQKTLLNLLSNAVKYSQEGGRVTVGCSTAKDGMLRINVNDNGPGIAKADIARLFKPFDRLGAENSGVQGTGIGLTITKRLVEMMDGKLGVESKEGEGSTFWVDMPTHS